MKPKRSSAVLTLVIALFIGAYVAFGHIISVLNAKGLLIVGEFFNNAIDLVIAPFASIGWYVVVGVLALALILALIWVIRLIVYRRNVANYLSPLIFLVAVVIAALTAINAELIETELFVKPATQVVTGYFLITAAVIAALAIHLVVIGLARSGAVKQESLLVVEDDELYDDEEDSVLTFDEDDDEIEEVVEEEPVVEYEEVDEVEEFEDVDEIEEVEEVEEVVEEEPVESVVVHEIVQTIVQEPDYDSDKLEEIIRRIVREELKDKPAPAPAPAPKPVAKPAPAPAPKPVAKPAPAPKVAPKPVVKPKPEVVAKPTVSVARIPFIDRLSTMEPDIIAKYDELRDYLLSYDIKSRLSNSGDSFRLSRKLYAKITTSGSSGLKIYLPIDITDYADTKLPLKNASHIKAYEDVPTFLYIKSDLSVRRAKQLIDDIMLTDGIVRKFQREELDE